jgi:hypothetical protein
VVSRVGHKSGEPDPREDNLDTRLEWWRADCQKYGVNEVLEAFEYFVKTYPQVAYGRPITNFLMAGGNGRLVYEVRQRKAGALTSAKTPASSRNSKAASPKSRLGEGNQQTRPELAPPPSDPAVQGRLR